MPLPDGVTTITVTGKYEDLQGNPQSGTVTFTASTGPFNDPAVTVIFEPIPVVATLDNTGAFSEVLPTTDNSGFEPNSWVWNVTERVVTPRSYSIALPSTLGSSVDLSTLAQIEPTSDYAGYLLLSAGESEALGGTLWLNGSPPIALPSGTAGYVLTSDDDGNLTLQEGGGGGGGSSSLLDALGSISGAVTLNATTAGVYSATLTGNATFTFSGAVSGSASSLTLYLSQNATGGYTSTWPGSVSWLGGSAPTLNTAANALNVLVFESLNDGATWYGSLITGAPPLPLTVLEGGTGLSAGGAAGTLFTGQGTSSPGVWQGLFSQTAVQTSACTVAAGTLVPTDTSAASLTATLVSAPFSGAMCGVKQVNATVGTYATTVACGGTDVFNKIYGGTAATQLSLSLLDQGLLLQYAGAGSGWSFTGSSSTANLTISGGPAFAVGDVVFLTGGSLPAGLSASTRYYVVASATTTFQVSATYGGSAITPSGSGSGSAQTCGTWLVISDDLPLGQLDTRYDAAGAAASATAYYQRMFAV
jgi:hypothetical protein